MIEIESKYQELCNTPSDINQHLSKLREYASKCSHVTEFGVRGCCSTYAFLASDCEKVVSVDILNVWVPDVKKLKFINASSLEIEIEQTDFLFIDSLHTYDQLKAELNLHHKKVNKYIGFHDTFIFFEHGEDGGKGLNQAINEFLHEHEEWSLEYVTGMNNGLTILRRK